MARNRVLVIEDDPDLREIFADLVDRMGGDVHVAAKADEALRILEANKIDMIICDQNLPRMKGTDLLDLVRAKGCEALFILVSGGDIEAINSIEAKYKNFKFLSKPIGFDELVDEYNKVLA